MSIFFHVWNSDAPDEEGDLGTYVDEDPNAIVRTAGVVLFEAMDLPGCTEYKLDEISVFDGTVDIYLTPVKEGDKCIFSASVEIYPTFFSVRIEKHYVEMGKEKNSCKLVDGDIIGTQVFSANKYTLRDALLFARGVRVVNRGWRNS